MNEAFEEHMKYLTLRNIASFAAVAATVVIAGKWVAYDHHYHTVCLSGFSEELNRQGIVSFYWELGRIVIDPVNILIEPMSMDEDGLRNYRYKTTDELYSGLAIGHKCGVYDILPGDRDAWRTEKFGGQNSITEPKTQAFQL